MDSSILQGIVSGIHIRSNYGPDIDLADPFGQGATDPTTQALMKRLQPQITLDVTTGDPIVIAPYGAPGTSQWNALLGSLGLFGGVLFALAAYGGYKLLFGD